MGSQTTEMKQKPTKAVFGVFFTSDRELSADWLPREGSCVVSGKTEPPLSCVFMATEKSIVTTWQDGAEEPLSSCTYSYTTYSSDQKIKHWFVYSDGNPLDCGRV